MTTDVDNPFDEPTLLGVPVMRAAYSDRTAWLMSAMSEPGYRILSGTLIEKRISPPGEPVSIYPTAAPPGWT